jgi:hypothetical protein
MKALVLALSAIAVLAFSPGAFADLPQIDFAITGNGFTGSGVLDATAITSCPAAIAPCLYGLAGIYQVTGASGSLNGGSLAFDTNSADIALYNADDIVYLNGGPNLDSLGLLLTYSGVPNPLNLVYDPTLPNPDCTSAGTSTTCDDAIWTPTQVFSSDISSNEGWELPVSITTSVATPETSVIPGPFVATPEPNALTLLVTVLGGLLALSAMLRRRLRGV